MFRIPESEDDLNRQLVPDNAPEVFRLAPLDGTNIQARVRPFYTLTENYPYRMYFDLKDLPFILWS